MVAAVAKRSIVPMGPTTTSHLDRPRIRRNAPPQAVGRSVKMRNGPSRSEAAQAMPVTEGEGTDHQEQELLTWGGGNRSEATETRRATKGSLFEEEFFLPPRPVTAHPRERMMTRPAMPEITRSRAAGHACGRRLRPVPSALTGGHTSPQHQ